MITCLGKSCSFGQILCVSFFPFGIEGGMWDVIVLIIDPCLSFYFEDLVTAILGCTCIRSPLNCTISLYKYLKHRNCTFGLYLYFLVTALLGGTYINSPRNYTIAL